MSVSRGRALTVGADGRAWSRRKLCARARGGNEFGTSRRFGGADAADAAIDPSREDGFGQRG